MNTVEPELALGDVVVEAEQRVLNIQTKLHRWAREEPARRFDDLFNLVTDPGFLLVAWDRVQGNKGARTAGVDGRTTAAVTAGEGVGVFLDGLRSSLRDRSFHPLPVRERLADAGALASIGTVGDSYDNAMAESVIGLYKLECVRRDGPFRTVDDLELATLNWVHWFNEHRLHSSLNLVPPVEFETEHYRRINPRPHPRPGELASH